MTTQTQPTQSSALSPFNWREASPEQRNAACAQFLPASDTNPIKSWHLYLEDQDKGPLMVESLAKAEAWLESVRATRTNWKTYIENIPYAFAEQVTIKEHTRHVRYTDTPAGAWMLLDELRARGYFITIDLQPILCTVTAEPPRLKIIPTLKSPPTTGFTGSEPFPELAGMLFLTLNGIEVKS